MKPTIIIKTNKRIVETQNIKTIQDKINKMFDTDEKILSIKLKPITIYEFKKIINKTKYKHFFNAKTMLIFNETLKDYKIKVQKDNTYLIESKKSKIKRVYNPFENIFYQIK